jgi:hypothetical protein
MLPLSFLVKLRKLSKLVVEYPSSLEKKSFPNRKSTSQKTATNKICIVSFNLYRKTFLNSDWLKILFQNRTIFPETPDEIESYAQ